jgi:small subunit ribosomal protein S5
MMAQPNQGMRNAGPRPQSEFEERIVQIDRVARVQKGGRRFRFRATVVVGDRKGRVGLGVAKGQDVQTAIRKAVEDAKKSMQTIVIHNQSIPFSLVTRFSGAKLLLRPAKPGTGIIAGGAVRPVVELAGITNISVKSLGSDNRINNAKATLQALEKLSSTDISKLQKAESSKKAASKTEAKEPAAAGKDA